MSNHLDLESELRKALQRKQPSRDLMPVLPRTDRSWWKFAIAAALALSVGGSAYRLHERQQAQAQQVKAQLVFALRFTAEKLQHTRAQLQTMQLERHQ